MGVFKDSEYYSILADSETAKPFQFAGETLYGLMFQWIIQMREDFQFFFYSPFCLSGQASVIFFCG